MNSGGVVNGGKSVDDSHSTTCPYCGDALPPRRRKHCGQLACKRAFNRERANQFTAAHPGYYSKYDTADCYEHVCPVCGKTFKNHKDKPCHCSVKCWRDGQAEAMRSRLLPIPHPNPAPYSWLHANHPAILMQQRQTRRLFVGGTCARCGTSFVAHSECGIAMYCSLRCGKATDKDTRRARKRGAGHEPYRRIDIFERDGWRCHICGRKTRRDVHRQHPLAPTIDHLVPLGREGRDAPVNLACAHRQCNCIKSDTGGAQLRLIA